MVTIGSWMCVGCVLVVLLWLLGNRSEGKARSSFLVDRDFA
jgi:hypothetical protein